MLFNQNILLFVKHVKTRLGIKRKNCKSFPCNSTYIHIFKPANIYNHSTNQIFLKYIYSIQLIQPQMVVYITIQYSVKKSYPNVLISQMIYSK